MLNQTFTRRQLLKGGAALATVAAAQAILPTWMPRLAFAQPYNDPRGDVLISIFLRGGADALNMIVPHGDDLYYAARPQLAIPRPDALDAGKSIDLDGFFGIHPALTPLLPLFQSGELGAVHAVGSPHETRSHFEAMDLMERATSEGYEATTGWIARHLSTLGDGTASSPVRGVGWGTSVQTALGGAPSTVALQSIIDYHLQGDQQQATQMMQGLMGLYTLETGPMAEVAQSTQAAIDTLAAVGYENYVPRYNATYPNDPFGMALRQTAALIRADVGLEAACIDLGGWDTHANQGSTEGTQARLLEQLAAGLAAFHQDMGPDMGKVSVVVMSEFGRRLQENGSRGTDHGRAGAMLVMSGHLAMPGPVLAQWPGLTPDVLDRGDLAVTTDYRAVLSDMLTKRQRSTTVDQVFPGYTGPAVTLFEV